MYLQFQCIYRLLSNKIRALVKQIQTLRGIVPEEERCLMSLPNWVTEIPAMLPPALGCCSLVPIQTDGPHHYQASTPPWVAVETGISRGGKKKEQSPDQLDVNAGLSCPHTQFKCTSQGSVTGLYRTRYVCISSALTADEVVSDS